MRDFWVNVYPVLPGVNVPYRQYAGQEAPTRCDAERSGRAVAMSCLEQGPVYRLHIKLKPEGAPKRYISPEQRAAYETKQWPEINAYQRSLGL